ncbi:Mechanosensory protein 2 [Halotydeus destructor]|nr:Mechanosensory protein 2 [Halotydeus destructor]
MEGAYGAPLPTLLNFGLQHDPDTGPALSLSPTGPTSLDHLPSSDHHTHHHQTSVHHHHHHQLHEAPTLRARGPAPPPPVPLDVQHGVSGPPPGGHFAKSVSMQSHPPRGRQLTGGSEAECPSPPAATPAPSMFRQQASREVGYPVPHKPFADRTNSRGPGGRPIEGETGLGGWPIGFESAISSTIGSNTGLCTFMLTALSVLLIIMTTPLSLFFCIKVVQEYERAVIFRLGRLLRGGARGPGIFFVIPCIDTYTKVDLRTVSFDVPPQEILSRDSVTVAVDAVVYYRISNATVAVSNVEDYGRSTRLLAATTLRNVLGTKNLSEILSERESISHIMQSALDEATDPWGVKVERVEIKMKRLKLIRKIRNIFIEIILLTPLTVISLISAFVINSVYAALLIVTLVTFIATFVSAILVDSLLSNLFANIIAIMVTLAPAILAAILLVTGSLLIVRLVALRRHRLTMVKSGLFWLISGTSLALMCLLIASNWIWHYLPSIVQSALLIGSLIGIGSMLTTKLLDDSLP